LPNEFGTQNGDHEDITEMAKYAFFNEDEENANFHILRQKAEQEMPRLPTDFECDDNLATHKASHINFKRPATGASPPEKQSAYQAYHAVQMHEGFNRDTSPLIHATP
jgi:hypothetical protein